MDHFILNNDTWLKYLPIAVYVLLVIIITLLILIGFMLYKRYKYQNLKSRNHKSVFATAYAECSVQNASSSVPLKRTSIPEPENHFTHVQRPATPIPDRPKPEKTPKVLEFYFQYEDEYRI